MQNNLQGVEHMVGVQKLINSVNLCMVLRDCIWMTKQRPLSNWLRRLASWMTISEFRTTSTSEMIKEKTYNMELNIVQGRKTSSTKSCARISTRHKDSGESYQSWELTK